MFRRFLNPGINEECTNLWPDYNYCVRPVGSIKDYPGYGGSIVLPPIVEAVATLLPWQDIWSIGQNETTWPIVPIATDSRVDCEFYFWTNETDEASDCWNLAHVYGITREVRLCRRKRSLY